MHPTLHPLPVCDQWFGDGVLGYVQHDVLRRKVPFSLSFLSQGSSRFEVGGFLVPADARTLAYLLLAHADAAEAPALMLVEGAAA